MAAGRPAGRTLRSPRRFRHGDCRQQAGPGGSDGFVAQRVRAAWGPGPRSCRGCRVQQLLRQLAAPETVGCGPGGVRRSCRLAGRLRREGVPTRRVRRAASDRRRGHRRPDHRRLHVQGGADHADRAPVRPLPRRLRDRDDHERQPLAGQGRGPERDLRLHGQGHRHGDRRRKGNRGGAPEPAPDHGRHRRAEQRAPGRPARGRLVPGVRPAANDPRPDEPDPGHLPARLPVVDQGVHPAGELRPGRGDDHADRPVG